MAKSLTDIIFTSM